MIPVSGEQAMQLMQDGIYQEAELTIYNRAGTATVATFQNDRIISNSLTVQKSCSTNGTLELGAMVSDQLQVRVKMSSADAKNMKWTRAKLEISWSPEPQPMYVFSGIVTEVKRVSDGIYQLTATDAMVIFDAPYHVDELEDPDTQEPLAYPVTPYKLFRSIVYSKGEPYIYSLGVVLSVNPIDPQAPTDPDDPDYRGYIDGLAEDQGYTYRQVLRWCAQVMGVNVRIRVSISSDFLELWLWDWPQDISTWSDYYDPPYGIDRSNAYSIQDNDDEMGKARFVVKAGSSILYDSGTPNNEQGVISIVDNPVMNGFYKNYPDAFGHYCYEIQQRMQYYPAPNGHITGSVRATPRWWLQPGDIVGVMQNNQGVWMIPVNITHKLNGATTFEAGTQAIESTETSGSIPSFSPEQNNELTARFQDICWYPGESYSGVAYAHGYVTHGGDRLQLTFPLKKIFSPQTTKVNISSLIISLRVPTGGYIKTVSFDATQYIASKSVFGNSLHLTLEIANDTWYGTNNVPVCGDVQITMQVL